jgi:hypothetical protein
MSIHTLDLQGQVTASSNPSSFVAPSSTGNPSTPAGGSGVGGAIGMPAVSGGLLGAIAVTVAFLGGIARVIA